MKMATINNTDPDSIQMPSNSDPDPNNVPNNTGPESVQTPQSTDPDTVKVPNGTDPNPVQTPRTVYRCKKCRRIVASEEQIVAHERGRGEICFKWKKRDGFHSEKEKPPECSSIFVEPLKWMEETLQEGLVEEKLQCIGCKARLGSYNWAGMQCNCGAWINPAFQLHKSKLDECNM